MSQQETSESDLTHLKEQFTLKWPFEENEPAAQANQDEWVCFIRTGFLKEICILARSLQTHSFSLLRCYLMDWSGVDYCDISAVWTLILTAPIHCRASIDDSQWYDIFLQIWQRNKLYLDGLRMRTFPANVPFWINYSFNAYNEIQTLKNEWIVNESGIKSPFH